MRIEASLKRRGRAIIQLRDLYSMAAMCGMTSAEINTRVGNIRETTLAKCPHWARAHVDGYREALNDGLYRDSLAFGGYFEGRFYTTHSARPDYYGKHGIEPAAWADNVQARGHYWISTAAPKPFFVA
ncbi:hypothetical protein [Mesorhizobium sp. B2-1-2]|uniref:hypothetical protein n=1 Tax=Mesorhizobium sp. B2-1-2 TaxID=2589973 RepID=UPI001128EE67|nr:hypothetical protein [Mesorhizobium sp. B2-1-2]TPN04498.1 hypothetical protein FJ971_29575 [Mesorhizobium sp. B2-1-2]